MVSLFYVTMYSFIILLWHGCGTQRMIPLVQVQLGQHILIFAFCHKISKEVKMMMQRMWSLVYIKGIHES